MPHGIVTGSLEASGIQCPVRLQTETAMIQQTADCVECPCLVLDSW